MLRASLLVLASSFACGPPPDGEAGSTAGMSTSEGDGPGTTTVGPTTSTTGEPTTTDAPDPGPGTTPLPGEVECGPPCDAPWRHEGDLEIGPETNPAALRCLVEVTGDLDIALRPGPLPPELGNLRRVGGALDVSSCDELADLAGLECLERADSLWLTYNDELADVSALAGLTTLRSLSITGSVPLADLGALDGLAGLAGLHLSQLPNVTALPVPGPGSALGSLSVVGCGKIADLEPLAGVPGGEGGIEVTLVDDSALASVAALADLWPSMSGAIGLRLVDLPALTSLAGLAVADGAAVTLSGLPRVEDLEPLAGAEELELLALDDLPKVESLAPLAGLRVVDTLQLGSCSDNEMPGVGLDGVTDVSVLAGLESVMWLGIHRNDQLAALPDLPALAGPISYVSMIDNAALAPTKADAFIAAHALDGCAGASGECDCLEDP